MKRFGFLTLLTLILPVLLGGCTSSVRNVGRSEFTGTPGAIETIEVGSIDLLGQNLKVLAVREEDGLGGFQTQYFAQGGNGFLHQLAPAAVSAIGFYAGMDALAPDRTNINNSSSSEGGNAEGGNAVADAEGGVGGAGGSATSNSSATQQQKQDQSQKQDQRGTRPRIQNQNRHFDKNGTDLRQETKEKDRKQVKKD